MYDRIKEENKNHKKCELNNTSFEFDLYVGIC